MLAGTKISVSLLRLAVQAAAKGQESLRPKSLQYLEH